MFKVFTVDNIIEGFLAITSYAYHYFDIPNTKPTEFWSKMLNLHEDNTSWKPAILVVELCFCAPISNAPKAFQPYEFGENYCSEQIIE